jgi:hypothetical protein
VTNDAKEFLRIADMLPDAATVAAEARKRMGLHPLVAEQLHNGVWVVRPEGQLGTMGYYPYPWAAVIVQNATSAEDALRKARKRGMVRNVAPK